MDLRRGFLRPWLLVSPLLVLAAVACSGGGDVGSGFERPAGGEGFDFGHPILGGVAVSTSELLSGSGLTVVFDPRLPKGVAISDAFMTPATAGTPEHRQIALVFLAADGAPFTAFEYLSNKAAADADLADIARQKSGCETLPGDPENGIVSTGHCGEGDGSSLTLADGSLAAALNTGSGVAVFWYQPLTRAEAASLKDSDFIDPVLYFELQGAAKDVSTDELMDLANTFVTTSSI